MDLGWTLMYETEDFFKCFPCKNLTFRIKMLTSSHLATFDRWSFFIVHVDGHDISAWVLSYMGRTSWIVPLRNATSTRYIFQSWSLTQTMSIEWVCYCVCNEFTSTGKQHQLVKNRWLKCRWDKDGKGTNHIMTDVFTWLIKICATRLYQSVDWLHTGRCLN